MGSFMGRGSQYIHLAKVLYCKLPTNGKQLPAFPLEGRLGFELQSRRWEASVTTLPLWPLLCLSIHFLSLECYCFCTLAELLYHTVSSMHDGVQYWFPGLWGMGMSDAVFFSLKT